MEWKCSRETDINPLSIKRCSAARSGRTLRETVTATCPSLGTFSFKVLITHMEKLRYLEGMCLAEGHAARPRQS